MAECVSIDGGMIVRQRRRKAISTCRPQPRRGLLRSRSSSISLSAESRRRVLKANRSLRILMWADILPTQKPNEFVARGSRRLVQYVTSGGNFTPVEWTKLTIFCVRGGKGYAWIVDWTSTDNLWRCRRIWQVYHRNLNALRLRKFN